MEPDWTKFDGPKDTVSCWCGREYRSHTKLVLEDGYLVMWIEWPCPGCGKRKDNARKISSDRETFKI